MRVVGIAVRSFLKITAVDLLSCLPLIIIFVSMRRKEDAVSHNTCFIKSILNSDVKYCRCLANVADMTRSFSTMLLKDASDRSKEPKYFSRVSRNHDIDND